MNQLEVKYGLPAEVKFCKQCVISNQRPNSVVEHLHTKDAKKPTMHFDDEGVCEACRINELKKTINWDEREKELRELCGRYRRDDGRYDCILPGSGGKDSFYASHLLKTKYNMHPLTVTWAPHLYTDWGWKNMQSWIHAGFDNITFTPNGRVHRLLTRLAVENLFHPFQPFIFGQKSLAPKFAVKYKIPLVMYGQAEASMADYQRCTQKEEYYTITDKSKISLGGVSITELAGEYGLDEYDLLPYIPSSPEEIAENNIKVHMLGYYVDWYPQKHYYYAVKHGKFQASPERTSGTYSKYNSIDDKIDDFHYQTTYTKFGIGRATYEASYEIREGVITREEGVNLVRRYDHEFPERFAQEFYDYLTVKKDELPMAYNKFEHPVMDNDYYMSLTDKFRSPHLWEKTDSVWKLRYQVN